MTFSVMGSQWYQYCCYVMLLASSMAPFCSLEEKLKQGVI